MNAGQRPGASFEDAEVVENYIYRPPYPDAIYDTLIEISPALDSLLDIGCGPGKISRPLSRHFRQVTAVDPSEDMIALGQSLSDGKPANIEWIAAFAEDFRTDRRFDLAVAANSIHWMDHERLFANLAAHAHPDFVVARLAGDAPHEPDWQGDWETFMGRWVPELTGHPYNPEAMKTRDTTFQDYLDMHERRTFVSTPVTQSVEDFIKCQHSRETFAPSKLGDRRDAFDAELEDLLLPYAKDWCLTFRVGTSLEWGTLKGSRAMGPCGFVPAI